MQKYYLNTDEIGYVFDINYEHISILVPDHLKDANNGLSLNTILVVSNEEKNEQVIVRINDIAKIPQDASNIASLVETYKSKNENEKIDLITKKNFLLTAFSCKILGMIFKDGEKIKFGSDLSNFYSPFSYKVFKPKGKELENLIKISAGFSDTDESLEKYGVIRYASSIKMNENHLEQSPFYINPNDVLARRTALFGMTRTGKSNSIKKLVQTVEKMSTKDRIIGQIIFDINGEYANDNEQDGTSIYSKYQNKVKRYTLDSSKIATSNFKLLKLNFYDEESGGLQEGFQIIKNLLEDGTSKADYFQTFLSIEFEKPDENDFSEKTRYKNLINLYKCILYKAGFENNKTENLKLSFPKEIDSYLSIDTQNFISYSQAIQYFELLWKKYNEIPYITDYSKVHDGKEWASEDLKSLFIILTGAKNPGGEKSLSGYKKLVPLKMYHEKNAIDLYYASIISELEKGLLVIVDLSQGNEKIKQLYVDRLVKEIFDKNQGKFINGEKLNFFQLYFEEAHNIFPRQDTDLTQIYNRLAKEGAKYKIGLVYATQEVSAISPSILKNTENWFISHLNNDFELSTLKGYYDFQDFKIGLKNFSKNSDLGYSRIKMLSYPFTVPVQIDLFQ